LLPDGKIFGLLDTLRYLEIYLEIHIGMANIVMIIIVMKNIVRYVCHCSLGSSN
jgi:hypothetical protein